MLTIAIEEEMEQIKEQDYQKISNPISYDDLLKAVDREDHPVIQAGIHLFSDGSSIPPDEKTPVYHLFSSILREKEVRSSYDYRREIFNKKNPVINFILECGYIPSLTDVSTVVRIGNLEAIKMLMEKLPPESKKNQLNIPHNKMIPWYVPLLFNFFEAIRYSSENALLWREFIEYLKKKEDSFDINQQIYYYDGRISLISKQMLTLNCKSITFVKKRGFIFWEEINESKALLESLVETGVDLSQEYNSLIMLYLLGKFDVCILRTPEEERYKTLGWLIGHGASLLTRHWVNTRETPLAYAIKIKDVKLEKFFVESLLVEKCLSSDEKLKLYDEELKQSSLTETRWLSLSISQLKSAIEILNPIEIHRSLLRCNHELSVLSKKNQEKIINYFSEKIERDIVPILLEKNEKESIMLAIAFLDFRKSLSSDQDDFLQERLSLELLGKASCQPDSQLDQEDSERINKILNYFKAGQYEKAFAFLFTEIKKENTHSFFKNNHNIISYYFHSRECFF